MAILAENLLSTLMPGQSIIEVVYFVEKGVEKGRTERKFYVYSSQTGESLKDESQPQAHFDKKIFCDSISKERIIEINVIDPDWIVNQLNTSRGKKGDSKCLYTMSRDEENTSHHSLRK